jgi:hypothetical protein
VVDVAREEVRTDCPWCGASIPVANVWICETDVLALCTACHRMSHAADRSGVGVARRGLFSKRRVRKPSDAEPPGH